MKPQLPQELGLKYSSHWWSSQQTLTDSERIPFYTMEWIIALFGIVGNLTLLRIYMRKDRKIRFNNLMILIAFFDNVYHITDLASTILDSTSNNTKLDFTCVTYKYFITTEDIYVVLRVIKFFHYWSFSGSVYTTALIAFERYLSVCKEK